jgi:ATP-dependent DNA helicase RecG
MIDEMVRAGHPPPTFRDTPYSFGVTLYNVLEREPQPDWAGRVSERQAAALAHVERHGRITNREYRDLCPGLSPETLRLDLSELVDKGLLLKVGAKRGTYYILR